MLHLAFKVLISVRSKLFFSFLAMSVIVALLGGYAVYSTYQAGEVVEETFDKPLMAINYARSAAQTFTEIELAISQSGPDGVLPENITERLEDFRSDLDVARDRSIAFRAADYFDDAEGDVAAFEALLNTENQSDMSLITEERRAIGENIRDNLDIIIELQTNESFRERERSLATMQRVSRYTFFALGAALLLTLMLSSWLAVTIINPLNAAAAAARKISAGRLDADIPKGGDDETGVLLKTMALMQENIRARMGQEASLRTLAQNRLIQSLENSKDAILLTDRQDRIIVANRRMTDIFPSLAGQNLQDLPFLTLFSEDGIPHNEHCDRRGDEIFFSDGRWARVNASLTQEGGRLFIWTDISEDKRQAVILNQARIEAEAADKAKTTFMAAMSHELRTPLNAVIGFSDILASEKFGELGNPNYVEMADHISQSGAHLLNIITDVLDVADGRNPDEMRADFAPLDIKNIVAFAIRTLEHEAQSRKIELDFRCNEAALNVLGDKGRLQQCLINLVGNAVKFNREEGTVVVSGQSVKGHVVLDISDTGIGLEREHLERVFEPFFQVDAGHSRHYEGVGLGLTIARKIATEHGGQIRLHSVKGQGTTVRLALPEYDMKTINQTKAETA